MFWATFTMHICTNELPSETPILAQDCFLTTERVLDTSTVVVFPLRVSEMKMEGNLWQKATVPPGGAQKAGFYTKMHLILIFFPNYLRYLYISKYNLLNWCIQIIYIWDANEKSLQLSIFLNLLQWSHTTAIGSKVSSAEESNSYHVTAFFI